MITLWLTLGLLTLIVPMAYLMAKDESRSATATSDRSGPDTLEQLYSARLARGDIEGAQYVRSIRELSKQMRGGSRRVG